MDLMLSFLRLGFEEGLFTRDDVRRWVDEQLAQRSHLPAGLLELTTIAHTPDHEVVALMRELEPELDAAAGHPTQAVIPSDDELQKASLDVRE